MAAQIQFNPMQTTNASGSFNIDSTGFIQGTALNDPSVRNELAGGVLAASETLPMWGGVAISENVPSGIASGPPETGTSETLGGKLIRATSVTANANGSVTGFSVFDQDHSMINFPQSPVPLAASGMTVNFYRLGSGARIAVACDPSLVDLEGNVITQQVSWDFDLQRLVPYAIAEGSVGITSQTWSAGGGGIVTVVTSGAHTYVVGDDVVISGAAPAAYNGDVTILTVADNTHFTYAMPVNPGTSPASTPGTVNAGGGALNVRVLEVKVTNNMIVEYDPATGYATWNRNGPAAIILI
jgi:hypothetical protein